MNSNYIVRNDEVIVSDSEGRIKIVPYSLNALKILQKENAIEYTAGLLDEYIKKVNKDRMNLTLPSIGIAIASGFGGSAIVAGATSGFDSIFYSKFGPVSLPLFVSCVAGLTNMVVVSPQFFQMSKRAKEQNGVRHAVIGLDKLLSKQAKELKELVESDYVYHGNTGHSIEKRVDNPEEESIKKYVDYRYDLGYNSKKYYRAYKNGKLEEELANCNEEEIAEAKEVLEEHGPKLVKRYKVIQKK